MGCYSVVNDVVVISYTGKDNDDKTTLTIDAWVPVTIIGLYGFRNDRLD